MPDPVATAAERAAKRTVLLLGAVWLALFVLRSWFRPELSRTFWFFADVAWFLVCAAGWALLVRSVLLFRASRTRRGRTATAYLLATTVVAAWFALGDLGGAIRHARLRAKIRAYEPVVARLRAVPPERRAEVADKTCRVDDGPFLRVAFSEPSDGYTGTAFAYDPSPRVPHALAGGGETLAPPGISFVWRWSGGEPVAIEPLGDGWYHCEYTDD